MNQLNFLSAGGEMGKLIREKDWSKTELGDSRDWPQSLKTTLSIILNSKFPKFIFWGDHLRCFYNDAYRPSLGEDGRHPRILGEKGAIAWPEIWDLVKPMMDGVLQTGEATWSEDAPISFMRNGRMEEMYWTFSYSPIVDENGKIAGIFTTVMETTIAVRTRNELKKDNERYYHNIMQAPVAMCVLRGENFVVDIANDLMLTLWGKPSYQILNKPIFEGLPEAKGQGLEAILEKVYHSGEKFTANERPVSLPRDGALVDLYLDFVYEPVKNESGKVTGVVAIASDVTFSVLARKKIEESEMRFKKVADHAPVLIWMSGTDKLRYYFNKAWLQFSGKTMEEEYGNGWAVGVHPDDFERCIEIYTSNFDKREEFYMEYRLKRYDGEYRWLSDNGVPRFTPDGVFEGFIGACMDIHDSVTSKQVLKESKEKLNIVIEATELAVWEFDYKKDSGSFDSKYASIFGYDDPNELTRSLILEHLHPEDKELRDSAHQKVLETDELRYETRILWSDGSLHWIDVHGKLFKDENGVPEKLFGTIRDITQDKKTKQDLIDREEKFRLLADEMPQFVWTADAEGHLNYFNRSVFEFSGLDESILLHDNWLIVVHPDDREENRRLWRYSVKTGEDFVFEHRFRRKDQQYRWQLSRAKALRDSSGKITMWVGTSTDIQEIKELDEQKDYFISMASHELKTPITSIKGYVQLLESKYRNADDPFLKNSLKVVHKQIESLTTLVADLLDVSKIRTGSLQLRKKYFDINSLIEEVVSEIQSINPQNGIQFSAKSTITVFADEENIRQVIINFLTNAVKYSPDSLKVKVDVELQEKAVQISVTDAGIGISVENQNKVFDRFFRVEGKNEKTFPGFGIGLFIAAEIINKHQGDIGVISKMGEGSTFYFTLPI